MDPQMKQKCDNKLRELQECMPFLLRVLEKLRNNNRNDPARQTQLDKIQKLYNLLNDKSQTFKWDLLVKCENVVNKLQRKMEMQGETEFMLKNRTVPVDGKISETKETSKPLSRDDLACPESPPPQQQLDYCHITQPVVIPTERCSSPPITIKNREKHRPSQEPIREQSGERIDRKHSQKHQHHHYSHERGRQHESSSLETSKQRSLDKRISYNAPNPISSKEKQQHAIIDQYLSRQRHKEEESRQTCWQRRSQNSEIPTIDKTRSPMPSSDRTNNIQIRIQQPHLQPQHTNVFERLGEKLPESDSNAANKSVFQHRKNLNENCSSKSLDFIKRPPPTNACDITLPKDSPSSVPDFLKSPPLTANDITLLLNESNGNSNSNSNLNEPLSISEVGTRRNTSISTSTITKPLATASDANSNLDMVRKKFALLTKTEAPASPPQWQTKPKEAHSFPKSLTSPNVIAINTSASYNQQKRSTPTTPLERVALKYHPHPRGNNFNVAATSDKAAASPSIVPNSNVNVLPTLRPNDPRLRKSNNITIINGNTPNFPNNKHIPTIVSRQVIPPQAAKSLHLMSPNSITSPSTPSPVYSQLPAAISRPLPVPPVSVSKINDPRLQHSNTPSILNTTSTSSRPLLVSGDSSDENWDLDDNAVNVSFPQPRPFSNQIPSQPPERATTYTVNVKPGTHHLPNTHIPTLPPRRQSLCWDSSPPISSNRITSNLNLQGSQQNEQSRPYLNTNWLHYNPTNDRFGAQQNNAPADQQAVSTPRTYGAFKEARARAAAEQAARKAAEEAKMQKTSTETELIPESTKAEPKLTFTASLDTTYRSTNLTHSELTKTIEKFKIPKKLAVTSTSSAEAEDKPKLECTAKTDEKERLPKHSVDKTDKPDKPKNLNTSDKPEKPTSLKKEKTESNNACKDLNSSSKPTETTTKEQSGMSSQPKAQRTRFTKRNENRSAPTSSNEKSKLTTSEDAIVPKEIKDGVIKSNNSIENSKRDVVGSDPVAIKSPVDVIEKQKADKTSLNLQVFAGPARRILQRRCTMIDRPSAPEVDKEKLHKANAMLFEDLQESERKKKIEATNKTSKRQGEICYEKTDDGCTVSTQNIITGKRRTRTTANFNEVQQGIAVFKHLKPSEQKKEATIPTTTKSPAASIKERKKPGPKPKLKTESKTEQEKVNATEKHVEETISKTRKRRKTSIDTESKAKYKKEENNSETCEKDETEVLPNVTSIFDTFIQKILNPATNADELINKLRDILSEKEVEALLSVREAMMRKHNSEQEQHTGKSIKDVATEKPKSSKVSKSAETTCKQSDDAESETVFEDNVDISQIEAANMKTKAPRRNELDRLHEDIRDMFISEGVLTATGKRMCTFVEPGSAKSANENEQNKASTENVQKSNEPLATPKTVSLQPLQMPRLRKTRVMLHDSLKINPTTTRRSLRKSQPKNDSNEEKVKHQYENDGEAEEQKQKEKEKNEDDDFDVDTPFAPSCSDTSFTSDTTKLSSTTMATTSTISDPSSSSTYAKSDNEPLRRMPILKPLKPIRLREEDELDEWLAKQKDSIALATTIGDTKRKLKRYKPCPKSKKPAGALLDDEDDADVEDSANDTETITKIRQKIKTEILDIEVPYEDVSTTANADTDTEDPPKNINPKWHWVSRYVQKCVVCKQKAGYISSHYKKKHNENYISRLAPIILQQLKQQSTTLNKPYLHCINKNKKNQSSIWLYRCPFCLIFKHTTFIGWLEHFITHTGEYIYECTLCHQSFNKPNLIEKHMKEKCASLGGRYLHNDEIKRSLKNNEIKAYVCHLCNYIRLGRNSLEHHYMEQHGYNAKNINDSTGYAISLMDYENVPLTNKLEDLTQMETKLSKQYLTDVICLSDVDIDDHDDGDNNDTTTASCKEAIEQQTNKLKTASKLSTHENLANEEASALSIASKPITTTKTFTPTPSEEKKTTTTKATKSSITAEPSKVTKDVGTCETVKNKESNADSQSTDIESPTKAKEAAVAILSVPISSVFMSTTDDSNDGEAPTIFARKLQTVNDETELNNKNSPKSRLSGTISMAERLSQRLKKAEASTTNASIEGNTASTAVKRLQNDSVNSGVNASAQQQQKDVAKSTAISPIQQQNNDVVSLVEASNQQQKNDVANHTTSSPIQQENNAVLSISQESVQEQPTNFVKGTTISAKQQQNTDVIVIESAEETPMKQHQIDVDNTASIPTQEHQKDSVENGEQLKQRDAIENTVKTSIQHSNTKETIPKTTIQKQQKEAEKCMPSALDQISSTTQAQSEVNTSKDTTPHDEGEIDLTIDEDDDGWEDIEIVETAPSAVAISKSTIHASKESKTQKTKINPLQNFSRLYANKTAASKSHKKSSFKPLLTIFSGVSSNNKEIKEATNISATTIKTTAATTTSTTTVATSTTSTTQPVPANPSSSTPIVGFRPMIANLSDLLPDSPCNDPIEIVPELAPSGPLQELNDITTLLGSNLSGIMDMDVEEPANSVCIHNTDNQQTSIQDALDFVASQAADDDNCLTLAPTTVNRIQNIGYTCTTGIESASMQPNSQAIKFYCFSDSCTFLYSSEAIGLENHFLLEHPQCRWNGYCNTCACQIQVDKSPNELKFSDEFNHLLQVHTKEANIDIPPLPAIVDKTILMQNEANNSSSSEQPRLKLRRLSGDCLSTTTVQSASNSSTFVDAYDDSNSFSDLIRFNSRLATPSGEQLAEALPPAIVEEAVSNDVPYFTNVSKDFEITSISSCLEPSEISAIVKRVMNAEGSNKSTDTSNACTLKISNVISLGENTTKDASSTAIATPTTSADVRELSLPKITNVCSLNSNSIRSRIGSLWSQQINEDREELGRSAADSREISNILANQRSQNLNKHKLPQRRGNNDSPGPLIVSETRPTSQATSGDFVITQTVSAQYAEETIDGGSTNPKVGFNISISSATISAPNTPTPTPTLTQNIENLSKTSSVLKPTLNCMESGCKYTTRHFVAIIDHVKWHEKKNDTRQHEYLRCSLCKQKLPTVETYTQHLRNEHYPVTPAAESPLGGPQKTVTLPVEPCALTEKIRNILNQNQMEVTPASHNEITESVPSKLDDENAAFKAQLLETIKEMVVKTGISERKLFRCMVKDCNVKLNESSYHTHVLYHLTTIGSMNNTFPCPHCKGKYQNISALKTHIKGHGRHRLFCYLCMETAGNNSQMCKHFAQKHWQKNELSSSVLAEEECHDGSPIVYYVTNSSPLSDNSIRDFGKKLTIEWQRKKAATRTHFNPDEIELLPIQAIFSKETYCALCLYKTKVRTNMVRHMMQHKNTAASVDSGICGTFNALGHSLGDGNVNENSGTSMVCSMDPINPVPCLISNEKHFDRMTNLASSSLGPIVTQGVSNTGGATSTNSTTSSAVCKLRYKYIQQSRRFKCGIPGCEYLTICEDTFRKHLHTLHSESRSYECLFCQEELCKRSLVVEKIVQHLRFHDRTIYQCEQCDHSHYIRHVIDRHALEKHGPVSRANILMFIRDEEGSLEGARKVLVAHGRKQKDPNTSGKNSDGNQYSANGNSAESSVTSNATNAGNSTKGNQKFPKFICDLCEHKTFTYNQIISHSNAQHGIKQPYQCPYCLHFTAWAEPNIKDHISEEHPGEMFKVNRIFGKMNVAQQSKAKKEFYDQQKSSKLNEPPLRPLWQRDDPTRARQIRGIPMEDEEESERLRKRLRLSDDYYDEEEGEGSAEDLSGNSLGNLASNFYLKRFEFGCFHCEYKANSIDNLKNNHWESSHNNKEATSSRPFLFRLLIRLKCAECQNFIGCFWELQKHMIETHRKATSHAADPRAKKLACGYCEFDCANTTQLLRHHLRDDHQPQDIKGMTSVQMAKVIRLDCSSSIVYIQCSLCSELFNSRLSVVQHAGDRHGDESEHFSFRELSNTTIYRCSECMYTSTDELTTLRHMINHYRRFKRCNFCNQPQTTFNDYMQHCYSDHRAEIRSFSEIYTLNEIRKYLMQVLIIFPNGWIINKKNLRSTPYGNDERIKTLYAEICKTSQEPPIPRLSLGRLVARKSIEAKQQQNHQQTDLSSPFETSTAVVMQLAGNSVTGVKKQLTAQKISKRRSTIAVGNDDVNFLGKHQTGIKKQKLSTHIVSNRPVSLAPPPPPKFKGTTTESLDSNKNSNETVTLPLKPYSYYGQRPDPEIWSKLYTKISIAGINTPISLDKFKILVNIDAHVELDKLNRKNYKLPRSISSDEAKEEENISVVPDGSSNNQYNVNQYKHVKKACPASQKYRFT